jgi:4-hydroxy-4-methyl-2-oxoglutarate aldolase
MIHIKKNVVKFDNMVFKSFDDQDTATIHEAMGRRGAMDSAIKSISKGMRICGRAITVSCHTGDNLMLIKAISMAKPGDVVVANMGNAEYSGPFGEVLATECMVKGMAGLIVSSSIRDSKRLIELGFPVFCRNISIFGTAKATLGTINHPISCGGVLVNPGDLILGDDDGVVVIPSEEWEEVLIAAQQRTEKEAAVIQRLRGGESLFDIFGYQKVLDELHCIEE